MFRMATKPTRRPKRAAQRHTEHSHVDVTSLTRLTLTEWEAAVTYSHALSSWEERVRFVVLPEPTASMLTVTITDSDFPSDRVRRVAIPRTADMVQFILDYLIAGRW
jgi:hypothetical protein